MKNNHGFSNILIALIIFFILGISSYILFQYLNLNKTQQTQIQIENSKMRSILIKNEISNYSISINDSITLDNTWEYDKSSNLYDIDKKMKKPSEIYNDSKGNELSITYVPNVIVLEPNTEYGKLMGYPVPSLQIQSFDKNFNANSYLLENGLEMFNENIEEKVINGFKTYRFYTPDTNGGGVSTVFVINEKHYLTISYDYEGAEISGGNKAFIELYNEIINSVKKINN